MRELAGLFAIEVCGYSVMSNHLHLVLRNRPDIAEQWSADEIALRSCRVFPPRDDATGEPIEPGEHDLAILTSNSGRLSELRKRLANLSWFMRCLCKKLQETAAEPASTTAVSAASPPQESALQAGPIAAAVADAAGGSQPSADFGPTVAVADPVEAPASAREGVRPRVPADPGRALCHAAGLDGARTPRGQTRGDSGPSGADHGAAGAQSIELGRDCARIRSTVQAGGGAMELAR
jgi:hypothetical protein